MAGMLMLAVAAGCATDTAGTAASDVPPPAAVEQETESAAANAQAEEPTEAEVMDERYRTALALQQAGKPADALVVFRSLAEAGHAESAFDYARALDTGEGVPRDRDLAQVWYVKAANLGSPRAYFLQGLSYANGAGVEQDMEKAAQAFTEAARRGHAEAQMRLGRAYANGEGVDRDVLWAMRWYDRAAVQGNADAQFAYAVQLASGENIPLDLPLAAALMEEADRNGHALAGQILPKIQSRLTPEQQEQAAGLLADLSNAGPPGIQDRPTVRYVQKALGLLGIDVGAIDGWMGENTRAGIRIFQEQIGLTPDGAVTDDLLDRLRGALKA